MIRGSGVVIIYTTKTNKMARIVIGEGLWSAIYANLNAMFTEIYAALASVGPGGGSGDANKYQQTINLGGGGMTRITTPITTEPYSVMLLDSGGKIIGPHLVDIQLGLIGGVYVLDIYSSDVLLDLKLKITY